MVMVLFGTIGTISRFVSVPTAYMCCARSFIGAAVLLLFLWKLYGRMPDIQALMDNLGLVIFAGIMNGLNWLLIFEGFRRTTVAIASICYYTEPIFLLISAPLFFGEKITPRKVICIAVCFAGMVLVSDPLSGTVDAAGLKGIAFSVMAAIAYTANVIATKKMRNISSVDVTVWELLIAGIVLLIYILFSSGAGPVSWSIKDMSLIALLGVVHTGFGYAVYYSSVRKIRADTASVLGYIDPVTSGMLSIVLLGEAMAPSTAAGAVLILAASFIGPSKRESIRCKTFCKTQKL